MRAVHDETSQSGLMLVFAEHFPNDANDSALLAFGGTLDEKVESWSMTLLLFAVLAALCCVLCELLDGTLDSLPVLGRETLLEEFEAGPRVAREAEDAGNLA
jgi:hypothetical protein